MKQNIKPPKIILASSSPRRKEILEQMGLVFDVVPGNYEEDMTLSLSPHKLTKHLALGKASDVAAKFPDALVVGADTIVVCEGKILGKPHTPEAAKKILEFLSGKSHEVITGMAIIYRAKNYLWNETFSTIIVFKHLTAEQINEYVATGEPLDKAGAYAAQALGRTLIEKIDGDFWNVVGLHACSLTDELAKFGITAKHL